MDELEKVILYAELESGATLCELAKCEGNPAIDFIIQGLGFKNQVEMELIIPICQECLTYIDSGMWVLLYCIRCNESQWVYKPLATLEYGDNTLIWMDECPKCNE